MPNPQAAKCAGSSDLRAETGSGEEAERGLRPGRLRRRQAGAPRAASRTDGPQSQCGAEFGRGDGGNADRASPSRADEIAEDHGQHQCNRVGVLDCRARLPERETLARRRPAGALGGIGRPGRGEAVSPGPGIQTDSGAHQRMGSSGTAQVGGCQTEKGVVEWVTRGPLLSTEFRAFSFRYLSASNLSSGPMSASIGSSAMFTVSESDCLSGRTANELQLAPQNTGLASLNTAASCGIRQRRASGLPVAGGGSLAFGRLSGGSGLICFISPNP